jgi:hypothetical protein
MMRSAAFVLLKAGLAGPESAQQAEIRLAFLLKILPMARSRALRGLPQSERRHRKAGF